MAQAVGHGLEAGELLDRLNTRCENATAYVAAYEHCFWPVARLDDLRLAPFHILATEEAVHTDRAHTWHMELLARCVVPIPNCSSPHHTARRPLR